VLEVVEFSVVMGMELASKPLSTSPDGYVEDSHFVSTHNAWSVTSANPVVVAAVGALFFNKVKLA
jgi:hypothetical protein